MTVIDLYWKLAKLIVDGHKNKIVQILDVEDGITFAVDVIDIELALPYDGNRVWLHQGTSHFPEWI